MTSINVEKLFPSGGLELWIIKDYKVIRQKYFGYTKAEAKKLFRQYLKKHA